LRDGDRVRHRGGETAQKVGGVEVFGGVRLHKVDVVGAINERNAPISTGIGVRANRVGVLIN
jgi:hypothetical protein